MSKDLLNSIGDGAEHAAKNATEAGNTLDVGGSFTNLFSGGSNSLSLPSLGQVGWYGGGAALTTLASAGIQVPVRRRLNTLLGGKYTLDDDVRSGVRSVRTGVGGLISEVGAGGVAGGIVGAALTNKVLGNRIEGKWKKRGAMAVGGAVGAFAGSFANKYTQFINGFHLGEELSGNMAEYYGHRENIQSTSWKIRKKLLQLGVGVAGGFGMVGAGMVVPGGVMATNFVGFNASDHYADQVEARNNSIAGNERPSGISMGSFMSDFDNRTDEDGNSFVWSNATERGAVVQNINNLLSRIQSPSYDEAERKKLFEMLKKYIPLRYKELSEFPAGINIEQLLLESSQNIVAIKKKMKKEKALKTQIDALPSIENVMVGVWNLHNAVSVNEGMEESEIVDYMNGGAHDWKIASGSLNIRKAVLQKEEVKEFLATQISPAEMRDIWVQVDTTTKQDENIDEIINLFSDAQKTALIDSLELAAKARGKKANNTLLKENFSASQLFNTLSPPVQSRFWDEIIPSSDEEIIGEFEKISPLEYWKCIDSREQQTLLNEIENNQGSLNWAVRESIVNINSSKASIRPNSPGSDYSSLSSQSHNIFTASESEEVEKGKMDIKGKIMEILPMAAFVKEGYDQIIAPLLKQKKKNTP